MNKYINTGQGSYINQQSGARSYLSLFKKFDPSFTAEYFAKLLYI